MSRRVVSKIFVEDGKYSLVQQANGRVYAFKYGKKLKEVTDDPILKELMKEVLKIENSKNLI